MPRRAKSGMSVALLGRLPGMRRSWFLLLLPLVLCVGCGDPGSTVTTEVEAFLAGWAEPVGDGLDEATGYPMHIRRLRDGMEMALVPAGTFLMGALPGDALGKGVDDEHPRHEVTLTKAYYVDVHEVTNEQFLAFAEATEHVTKPELRDWARVFSPQPGSEEHAWIETPGASWRSPQTGATRQDDWEHHPVVLVSWGDATAYAAWAGAELPTEAQFERALRAGVADAIYPWGDEMPPGPPLRGNFQDTAFRERVGPTATGVLREYDDGHVCTAPVMSYPPNDYGLYDLSGNVWEWCRDGWQAEAYTEAPRTDPVGQIMDPGRVRRGGGWMTGKGGRLRCSWRGVADAVVCRDYMGFRLAKSLP